MNNITNQEGNQSCGQSTKWSIIQVINPSSDQSVNHQASASRKWSCEEIYTFFRGRIQISTCLHWKLDKNSSNQLPRFRAGIFKNRPRDVKFRCLVSDLHQFWSVPVVYIGPQLEQIKTGTPGKVTPNWYG